MQHEEYWVFRVHGELGARGGDSLVHLSAPPADFIWV